MYSVEKQLSKIKWFEYKIAGTVYMTVQVVWWNSRYFSMVELYNKLVAPQAIYDI